MLAKSFIYSIIYRQNHINFYVKFVGAGAILSRCFQRQLVAAHESQYELVDSHWLIPFNNLARMFLVILVKNFRTIGRVIWHHERHSTEAVRYT